MELRTEADHLRALSDPDFHADGIWSGDRFAGLIYYWQTPVGYYIEHLAVAPQLRGGQIGSKALSAFCADRRVVLEIDPPVDEISIRRLHFYERLGFMQNPQEYIHPSYQRVHAPYRLVLMSYPSLLEADEARTLADFIRERVMCYSEHLNLALPKLP